MKKIAFLISDNLLPNAKGVRRDRFELVEQVGKLKPALAAQGMELFEVRWREIAGRAGEFDGILPLMVWDYFQGNEEAFLTAIAEAERVTPVFNDFDTLKWNADKSYLDELKGRGAPVIRTTAVDFVTQSNIARAFEELETDTLVIKPRVGGGAWRQVLYRQGDPFPEPAELPPEGALLKPSCLVSKKKASIPSYISGDSSVMPCGKRPKRATIEYSRFMAGMRKPMFQQGLSERPREAFWIHWMSYRFTPALIYSEGETVS